MRSARHGEEAFLPFNWPLILHVTMRCDAGDGSSPGPGVLPLPPLLLPPLWRRAFMLPPPQPVWPDRHLYLISDSYPAIRRSVGPGGAGWLCTRPGSSRSSAAMRLRSQASCDAAGNTVHALGAQPGAAELTAHRAAPRRAALAGVLAQGPQLPQPVVYDTVTDWAVATNHSRTVEMAWVRGGASGRAGGWVGRARMRNRRPRQRPPTPCARAPPMPLCLRPAVRGS